MGIGLNLATAEVNSVAEMNPVAVERLASLELVLIGEVPNLKEGHVDMGLNPEAVSLVLLLADL